jgi:hypothetical protein
MTTEAHEPFGVPLKATYLVLKELKRHPQLIGESVEAGTSGVSGSGPTDSPSTNGVVVAPVPIARDAGRPVLKEKGAAPAGGDPMAEAGTADEPEGGHD